MFQPLKGVRVLDFTRLIPGPFCSKILCDLGATVIKIEDLKKGDYIGLFPPRLPDGASLLEVYFHKNKRRVRLDFTLPAGAAVVRRLVRQADVVMESYRPGVMAAWGIGFKHLKRERQRLIYASITGYGQRSRRAAEAGHDLNFLAVSGMLETILPRGSGNTPRFQLADFVGGGLFAALQITAALAAKPRQAVWLDVAMVEAMTALSGHLHFADDKPDMSAVDGRLARYRVYTSQDGRAVCLGALEDKFWERLCRALGRDDWLVSGRDPQKNVAMCEALKALFARHTAAYWREFGDAHDVCLSVVADKQDLITEGWLKPVTVAAAGQRLSFHEAGFGGVRARQSFARAGRDTLAVLKSAGYSALAIRRLRADGVIA